jgi:hypothetical protein
MNAKRTQQILTLMPVDKSVMLRAKHGVGKSSVVKQSAIERGMQYHDVRLSQCEVGDIKGLPHIDLANSRTVFMKPYWWPRDPQSKGILFFDELNRASKDVLQAVFEICLDRRLDGESLPDGWRVVAAINGDDDYDVAELDPALLDRWFMIDFDPTPKEWIDWARANKVHPGVIEFIARNNNLLDPPVGNMEAGEVTPSRRSWQALSDTMKAMNLESDHDGMLTEVAKGWVGRKIAITFSKFISNEFSQLKASDLLDDWEKSLPKVEAACSDIEVIAALADSLIAEINSRPAAKMKEPQLNAIKSFIGIIPKDAASKFWLALTTSKSKKLVSTWAEDKEFCEVLGGIFGIGKK